NGQLWGQAERYLQRSLGFRNDSHTHALLGSLYDRLDRPADAVRHWRLATAASMALPVLAVDQALPAAETSADPLHLDAEGDYSAYPPESGPSSVTAMYSSETLPQAVPADYVLDPDARAADREHSAATDPEPAAVPPARSAVDIEDYFDSAPIPVAAFDVPVPTYGTQAPKAPADAASRPDDDHSHSSPNKQG